MMDEDLRLAAIEASKLFKKGKYEDAVDICTLGISDYPQYSSLYLILAKSYIALGNVSEAHKVFESASKFFVNDPLINTLKDILEATPSINSEPPKKKTQQPINNSQIEQETTFLIAETVQNDESNSIVNEDTQIEESITEESSYEDERYFDNDDVVGEIVDEIFHESSIDEVEVETFSYDVENFGEQEHTTLEQEEDASEFSINEILTIDTQEDVNQDVVEDEEEIEYEDVLSGFDQIVSTLKTDEFEQDSEEINQTQEDISTTTSTSSTKQFFSFETPVLHSSSNNFINKIRSTTTPIETAQFSIEKKHFLNILPSLNAVADSVKKVHHLDDFHITLENPLQDMNIVSNETNKQMIFEDTYISRRRKNDDRVVFDHSIEVLDSIDSNGKLSGKKA